MHFPRPSLHQLERKAPELLGLVALALTLYLAAAAVTAWIAGFHTLDHLPRPPDVVVAAALARPRGEPALSR